ncbi:hypothetical protein SSS_02977 [Sarcoptes scabiei]|uniref:Uncharacterized protein n=1 Tax=Sarcoptes scabiei TaxID=52283 RepID=A0A834RC80_SARSC|nr:hypothetical protein SSS_02977 [Sarcoptes scabiei]
MSRPKSATNRSFLDQLLNDDLFEESNQQKPTTSTSTRTFSSSSSSSSVPSSVKQRKSVRFFNDLDDQSSPQTTKLASNKLISSARQIESIGTGIGLSQQQTTNKDVNIKPHSSALESLFRNNFVENDEVIDGKSTKENGNEKFDLYATPNKTSNRSSLESHHARSSMITTNRSKADWLGIVNNDDVDVIDKNNDERIVGVHDRSVGIVAEKFRPTIETSMRPLEYIQRSPQVSASSSVIRNLNQSNRNDVDGGGGGGDGDNDDEPDWIASGLRARRLNQSIKASNLVDNQSDQKNISFDSKFVAKTSSRPSNTIEEEREKDGPEKLHNSSVNGSMRMESQSNNLDRIQSQDATEIKESILENRSQLINDTQLRMLSMEKNWLEKTIDRMKSNHQEEIRSMISIYEIQDERERRIVELKKQLEQSENELKSIHSKYRERLETIEKDYNVECDRLKQSHSDTTKKMIEEHELELKRLEQRLRTETEIIKQNDDDSIRGQTKQLSELLAKWENSVKRIEQLQRSVLAKQEELIQKDLGRMISSDDDLFYRFDERCEKFLGQILRQQNDLEANLKNENQKLFSEERENLQRKEKRLDEDQRELEELRMKFANEVNDWRQNETIEANRQRLDRDRLKENLLVFEERRSLLETLYNERKRMLDDQQSRLDRINEEISSRQKQIEEKESKIMEKSLRLEQENQEWLSKRNQFDEEKIQLQELGRSLMKRADVLEKLSRMGLKEKIENIEAMDEIETIRLSLKKETEQLEQEQTQIRLERNQLAVERKQLEQQFRLLMEMKRSLVCNLCGNSLNRIGNFPSILNNLESMPDPKQSFEIFLNGGYYFQQNSYQNIGTKQNEMYQTTWNQDNRRISPQLAEKINNNTDIDQLMLFWQMSAQKDAASLADETKFLNIIMNKRNDLKFKPFKQ